MKQGDAKDLVAKTRLAALLHDTDVRAKAPYGLPLPASNELIHFGSCTANPITSGTLERAQALKAKQAWPDPAQALQTLFGAAQCTLAASGTDAEYTCALAMGSVPYCAILMDPAEIGSGCAQAAAGLPHAKGCPVDRPLNVHNTIETTRLRRPDGQALTQAEVDEQVFAIAHRHHRQPLLLHHVACSKTGLCAPSEQACLQVQRGHGAGVRVVVDAAQGRCLAQDVRRWLDWGWAVMLTGSKFFGAPPFCGATLFPHGWPKAQGFLVGPGLLARWQLALEAMSAVQPSRDTWAQAVQASFLPSLDDMWVDRSEPLDRQGILSFDLGLAAQATLHMHRSLISKGFFLGQPVVAGQRHLLRVSLGVHTPMATLASDLERLATALHHERVYG